MTDIDPEAMRSAFADVRKADIDTFLLLVSFYLPARLTDEEHASVGACVRALDAIAKARKDV